MACRYVMRCYFVHVNIYIRYIIIRFLFIYLFIHLLNQQNAPWTFINITQGTKLMGMKATAAISSHHCHWFCWWVTSVFLFFTGASINFTVILLQKVKIPLHLNISRPLLSYSVPPQISRCSWFSGEPVQQNLQLKSPCDWLDLWLLKYDP